MKNELWYATWTKDSKRHVEVDMEPAALVQSAGAQLGKPYNDASKAAAVGILEPKAGIERKVHTFKLGPNGVTVEVGPVDKTPGK